MSPLVDIIISLLMNLWPRLIRGLDGFVTSLDLWPCWICGFAEFTASIGFVDCNSLWP